MTNESRWRSLILTGWAVTHLLVQTAVAAGDAKAVKPKELTGYGGVPWGASQKQLREILALNDEWDCVDLHEVRHCETSFVLGDLTIRVTLGLIEDRFGRVSMTFPTSEFGLMRTTFIEKYGSPASSSAPTIRTRMNVPYRNTVLRWQWDVADATVEQFGENVERGRASITTHEFRDALKTLDERAKRRAQEAP